ncbi:MAG: hypothetical protein ACLQU4_08335 [Limisphaerales bacterium]
MKRIATSICLVQFPNGSLVLSKHELHVASETSNAKAADTSAACGVASCSRQSVWLPEHSPHRLGRTAPPPQEFAQRMNMTHLETVLIAVKLPCSQRLSCSRPAADWACAKKRTQVKRDIESQSNYECTCDPIQEQPEEV